LSRLAATQATSGWTVGGGFEAALGKQVTLGVEYNYYDFGKGRYSPSMVVPSRSIAPPRF